jgi:Protein of unknown function (DUF3995)
LLLLGENVPVRPLAYSIAAIFAVLSATHIYWALGGALAIRVVIPEREGQPFFRPGTAGTLVIASLLAVAAALVLERAAVGPGILSPAVSHWGTWGVACAFTARGIGEFNYVGLFKRRRGTRFATLDTRFYSPLALALGVGAGIVAWG